MLAPIADETFVGDVRQAGFMIGIEMVRDKKNKIPFPYEVQAGRIVANQARRLSLLVRPIGNVLIFMPPLAATDSELEEMSSILKESFLSTRDKLSRL